MLPVAIMLLLLKKRNKENAPPKGGALFLHKELFKCYI